MRAENEAIIDAADLLLSSLDVLLDRLASGVQRSPAAGSAQWRFRWDNRDTSDGRALVRQHLLIKIAIARAARINPVQDIDRARRAAATAAELKSVTRKSHRSFASRKMSDDAQLTIW